MKPTRNNRFVGLSLRGPVVVLSITLAVVAPAVHAASGTWTGAAGNWTDPTKWLDNVADGENSTANFTGFDVTASTVMTVVGTQVIGNIIYTDTSASNGLTISGGTELNLAVSSGAPTITATGSPAHLTISTKITGNDGLTKAGTASLTLTGANTYTGTTTLSGGITFFNSISHDGVTPSASGLGTTPFVISSAANIHYNGAANLVSTRGITANANVGVQASAGQGTYDPGIITGGSFALTKGGSGTVILNQANTWTGGTFVSGGTLSINTIYNFTAPGATAGSLGLPNTLARADISIGSTTAAGTLVYTGTGHSSDRRIKLNGSTGTATLEASGTGALKMTNATMPANTAGVKTFILGGTNVNTNLFTGAIVDNGAVTLTKNGTGTWVLTGTNTYTGGTNVNLGTLVFGNTLSKTGAATVSNLASVGLGVAAGGYTAAQVGDLFNASLAGFTMGTNSGVAIDTTGAIGAFDQNVALTNVDRPLNKLGSGTLTLSQVNTMTGTTTVTEGTLAIGSAGSLGSSKIIVGAGATFDVSAVSGGYTLGTGQTLSGTGTVVGAMNVTGTLSPGNSPGIMATDSQTWSDGGDYNWQIHDATGSAGTGFDQIQVTGTLDLSSLTAGGFDINLWSLASVGPDVNDDALNFGLSQSWNILTTSGGITGFESGDFNLNTISNNGTAGFSNSLAPGTSFQLGVSGNNLVLTYIPEPRAAMLGALGLLALGRRRRN